MEPLSREPLTAAVEPLQIREIEGSSDLDAVRALHEKMNLGFSFPNLEGRLFVLKEIVSDPAGRIVAAAAVKITAEAFLWLDPNGNKGEKVRAIVALNEKMTETARQIGLDEVSAWIPPSLELKFASFLHKLGFNRSPWASWSCRL